MTYSVKNSAQTTTYTVNDNTENSTSTSLVFIGKNYTGYGLALNENFLYLLENFSNTVGNYPLNPVPGQLFWDNTNKYMHVYDGTAWKVIYGALASLTVNSAVSFNGITTSNGGQVSGYLTGAIGANVANSGVFTTVTTNNGGQHIGYHTGAIGANVANSGVFTTVTTNNGGQLTGYHTGAIGANTANSGAFTTVTTTGSVGIGTSSPSSPLNVVSASSSLAIAINGRSSDNLGAMYFYSSNGSTQYSTITASASEFRLSSFPAAAVQTFFTNSLERMRIDANGNMGLGTTSPGAKLDVAGNILLSAAGARITFNSGGGTIANNIGNSLQFYADGGTTELMRLDNAGNLNIYGGAVRAATINAGTIGNSGATFTGATYTATGNITAQAANVYATNIIGNTAVYSAAFYFANGTPFTSSNYGNTQVAGYLGAAAVSVVPSANASLNLGSTTAYWNNVYAVNFLGTSTTAKYADLAEKYLPDADYEIGTVMMVGGSAEVTKHNGDRVRAIGVTSEYPAYKMNSDLDGGVYVALKGRVPVRVVGPVKKGQSLFGSAHGLAMATDDTTPTSFAIALESFDGNGIGSIEAVIL